jgi:hypothetical protein
VRDADEAPECNTGPGPFRGSFGAAVEVLITAGSKARHQKQGTRK